MQAKEQGGKCFDNNREKRGLKEKKKEIILVLSLKGYALIAIQENSEGHPGNFGHHSNLQCRTYADLALPKMLWWQGTLSLCKIQLSRKRLGLFLLTFQILKTECLVDRHGETNYKFVMCHCLDLERTDPYGNDLRF